MELDQNPKKDGYVADSKVLPQSNATDTFSSLENLIREFGLDPHGPVQCGLLDSRPSNEMWVFYGSLISHINRQWGDSLENQQQVLKELSIHRSFSDYSGYIFLMENTAKRDANLSGKNFKKAVEGMQSPIGLLSIIFYGAARKVCSELRIGSHIAESGLVFLVACRLTGSKADPTFYLNQQTILSNGSIDLNDLMGGILDYVWLYIHSYYNLNKLFPLKPSEIEAITIRSNNGNGRGSHKSWSKSLHNWMLLAETHQDRVVKLEEDLKCKAKKLQSTTITSALTAITPLIYNSPPFDIWEGHAFRSEQEIRIAKALDERGVLFFPNAGCRITEKKTRKTKEADFLVIIEGNIGILECDGKAYHQTAAEDHQRDRNFHWQGIRFIQRYSYEECLQEYQVVDDFIALMRKHFSL